MGLAGFSAISARRVKRQPRPGPASAPGFFDQAIPCSDWKASLNRALGTAEVFVPLYSPGTSPGPGPAGSGPASPARDPGGSGRAITALRARAVGAAARASRTRPGLSRGTGGSAPANPNTPRTGCGPCSDSQPYHDAYAGVVEHLAGRIVAWPRSAVPASDITNIDEERSPFAPRPPPAVHGRGRRPDARASPGGQRPGYYGEQDHRWRPFPQDQGLSARRVRRAVAERLDFAVMTPRS